MTLHGFYTNKGRALAAKIAAGTAEMTVTRVVAGDGHTADIPSATDLPSQKQTLSVGLPSVSGATWTLSVTLLEAGASVDYALTELGVYANDPDAGEILFQVCQLDAAADIIAGGEGVLRFYLRQSIGADGVSVVCSPAGVVLEEDIAELRAKAEYADHRNLLDNPWFTVNQRGKTQYIGLQTVGQYTVDRWKMDRCGTISVHSGDITITKENEQTWLNQPLEPSLIQELRGKTVTATVDVISIIGTWYLFSNALNAFEIGTLHQGLNSFTFTVRNDASPADYDFALVCKTEAADGDTISVRAIKLELGSISTLANDAAPDYAEELAKCQRYFQRFKTQSLRQTDKDDFRPVMRVNPATSTITVGGTTYYTATADL